MQVRQAVRGDAAAIATIYNQGIEDRSSTFETRRHSADEVTRWFDGVHPIIVAECAGQVIAFASTARYLQKECSAGIAAYSVYVHRDWRGHGAGRAVLEALIDECERAGFWKLVSRILPHNAASRALARAVGFREVGIYEKHGKIDGVWHDAVIVERLLYANIT